MPYVKSFFVIQVDGDIEPGGGDAKIPGDQIPGKENGVQLEIVPEREISQHLEKGVVTRGFADIFEVVLFATRPDAFLRSGGAQIFAFLQSQKRVFELIHPRIGKKQRRIVGGDQGRTLDHPVSVIFKIFQEVLSQLVSSQSVTLVVS
jgi:hypothetical protein